MHDLFSTLSQARPDSGKDLDIQREVVVSMLLRVIQYPEVPFFETNFNYCFLLSLRF